MADIAIAELGAARTQGAIELSELRWTRRRVLPRRQWVPAGREVYDQDDWTIDGTLLRTILTDLWGNGFEQDRYASPMSPAGDPRDAVTSIEVLLGARPTPLADGRSAIFVCSHDFDSYCSAVTAEVTFTEYRVIWSALREQSDATGYRGEPASVEFHFEGDAYERTLRGLLMRYRHLLENWESPRMG